MMAIVIKTFPNAHTPSLIVFSFHGSPHLSVNSLHLNTNTETRSLLTLTFSLVTTVGQFWSLSGFTMITQGAGPILLNL